MRVYYKYLTTKGSKGITKEHKGKQMVLATFVILREVLCVPWWFIFSYFLR